MNTSDRKSVVETGRAINGLALSKRLGTIRHVDSSAWVVAVIIILVVGFAVLFPTWLSVRCSSSHYPEQPNLAHANVTSAADPNANNSGDKSAARKSVPLKGVVAESSHHQSSEGHNHPAQQSSEWGRQFWCEVNASDYFIALFTFALAGVTLLLWYSTHLLWKSGEQQVRLSRDALVLVERPFVFPDSLTVKEILDNKTNRPSSWRITVQWRNSGKTPALRTITHWNSTIRSEELPNFFDFPDHNLIVENPSYLGPNAIYNSGELIVDLESAKQIKLGTLKCYAWGWYEYNDSFEGSSRHRSEFCFELAVVGDPFPEASRFVQVPYPKHNGTDAYCFHSVKTTGYETSEVALLSTDMVGDVSVRRPNIRFDRIGGRLKECDSGYRLIFGWEVKNYGSDAGWISNAPIRCIIGLPPPAGGANFANAEPVPRQDEILIHSAALFTNAEIDLPFAPTLDSPLAEKIRNNEVPAYLIGEIHYFDAMRKPHKTGFCVLLKFEGDTAIGVPVISKDYWKST